MYHFRPSSRLADGGHLTDSEDEAELQQHSNGLALAPQVSPPTFATLHPPMTSNQTSASHSQNELRHEKGFQSPSSTYWNADQDHRTSTQWHQQFECKCLQSCTCLDSSCFVSYYRQVSYGCCTFLMMLYLNVLFLRFGKCLEFG